MSKSRREPSELVVDGICGRFEDALKNAPSAKQRPQVEEFLSEAPESLRARLLLDLVGLDVDYRRSQNEAPLAFEYRERFPHIDRAWLDRLLPAEATIGSDARQPNANAQSDKNLLLGILAYQNAFITRDGLLAGMQAWLYDKGKSLAEILQNQGALDPDRRALLEALVCQHLKQNDDDPRKSLQSVSSISSVREELEQLPDPALQASIAHLSKAPQGDDLSATRPFLAGESTSQGTRFRILRPHAKGGLGQVSVALDSELNREVALKEIQSRYADNPESRARFILEAEITGSLEHPGIVPVYGLGTYADGRPFYAMRFIKGDSLMDAIEKFYGRSPEPSGTSVGGGPARFAGSTFDSLAFKQLLRRLIDVCNAMQYAHDRGVLHRDLKPGNIMLGKYGETLVVDWGLARARGKFGEPGASAAGAEEPTLKPASASGSAETVAGSAMGTPAYMSPEQAEGRLDLLGPASDVYSLGATLYCLLTGKAPMTGNDAAAVLARVQMGEFTPPRQIEPAISPPLEAICLKAMALKPAHRYGSPRELAEDIEHWLADEPVRAWPEPWTVKARRWVGRHRTFVTATAATILVAIVGLTIATALLSAANEAERVATKKAQDAQIQAEGDRKQAEGDRKQAVADRKKAMEEKLAADMARLQAEMEKKNKEKQLLRAESLLYASQTNEAHTHLQNNDLVNCRLVLDETRADLRGLEYGYLVNELEKRTRTLNGHTSEITSLLLSGDGKRLFSGSGHGAIKVWDLKTGKETLTLHGHTREVWSLALSGDGKRLCSGSRDKTIKVWDLEAGKETFTLRGHTRDVLTLALSGDGKRLFSGGGDIFGVLDDGSIKVWDLETRKETLILRRGQGNVICLALSGDGKRLFWGGQQDGTIKVWDLEAGKETSAMRGHGAGVTRLALSGDGKRLCSGSFDNTIKVWDLEAGKATLTLPAGWGTSLVLSGDGKRLFSSNGPTIEAWDLEAGKKIFTLRSHTALVARLALSGDGKRLFSGSHDKTIKAWDLESKETFTLRGHTGPILSLALSGDGKRLCSGSGIVKDGTIKVWDLETSKEIHTLRGHTSDVNTLALSGDGKRLCSGSLDSTIKVWDLKTGEETFTLRYIDPTYTLAVSSLALTGDGKRLFAGSQWSQWSQNTIKEWDLEAGKEILFLRGHRAKVTSLALSGDGKRLFSGGGFGDGTIKVWDLVASKAILTLPGNGYGITSLVLSGDGKRLFSGSNDKTIKMWDLEAGKETLTLRGHTADVTSLALSSDGKRLLSGSQDSTIKVWDLEAAKETLTLRGHTGNVSSLALSADNKRLYSGSWDKTIKVWDLEAGKGTFSIIGD